MIMMSARVMPSTSEVATHLVKRGKEDTGHEPGKDEAHPILRKDMFLGVLPVLTRLRFLGWCFFRLGGGNRGGGWRRHSRLNGLF